MKKNTATEPGCRRRANYWAPFNDWWRQELDAQGRRPVVDAITSWYNNNALSVWGEPPTLQETRVHAKCLRSLDDVRSYFQKYRQRAKGSEGQSEVEDQETEDEDKEGSRTREGMPAPVVQPAAPAAGALPMSQAPPLLHAAPSSATGGLQQQQLQRVFPLLPVAAAASGRRTQLTRMLQPKKQALKKRDGPAPLTAGTAAAATASAAAATGKPSHLGPSRLGTSSVKAIHCPQGPPPASPRLLMASPAPSPAGLSSSPLPQSSGGPRLHQSSGLPFQQQHACAPQKGSAQRPSAPPSSGTHHHYHCEMSVQRPPLSAATKNLGTTRTPCMSMGSTAGSGHHHAATLTSAGANTAVAGARVVAAPALPMQGLATGAIFGGSTSSSGRGAGLYSPTESLSFFGYTPAPVASASGGGGGIGGGGSSRDGNDRLCAAAAHSTMQPRAPNADEASADGYSTQGQQAPSQRGTFGYGNFPAASMSKLSAGPLPFFFPTSPAPPSLCSRPPSNPRGPIPAMGLPATQPAFCPLAWPPGFSSWPSAAAQGRQPMAVDAPLCDSGAGAGMRDALPPPQWLLAQGLAPLRGLDGPAVAVQQPYGADGGGSGGDPAGHLPVSPISQLLLQGMDGEGACWD